MARMDEAVETARQVATTIAGPLAPTTDREARWPMEPLRALQSKGLGGLVVPEEAGGMGLGLQGLARVGMELGRECASTALCFGMHNVGAAVIAAKATPAQQEEFIGPIVDGKHLTTLALSEPGSGAEFYVPHTRLEEDGRDMAITGTKCFVTNGGQADSYVVSTQNRSSDDAGTFSCTVVDRDGPGISWQDPWNGMGMRGNSSRTVQYSGHRLSRDRLLGASGDHDFFIFQVVAPYFLTAMAGSYLGLAGSALQAATDHLTERKHQNGRPLADHAVLQHRTGRLWAHYKAARSYLEWATEQGDRSEEEALPALLASKALAGEVAVETVNECMTLMGGIGYRDDEAMNRMLRDVRAVHVMSPTTDLLYTWTGRSLLGRPMIG